VVTLSTYGSFGQKIDKVDSAHDESEQNLPTIAKRDKDGFYA
jgi:hypothetical protein